MRVWICFRVAMFVTLDLEGFRSGSMNALLPADQLRRTG
jgi:hypothetical protein